MLRAVLLGVLTLTATSCKSHDAATSASQTVAAGKVIEVVGTVTLHHGTDTRPLAKGDLIDADDIVETGADGSAVIENQNNNVNWEIGPNKKSKFRDSLAWTAPKKNKNAKASEQDSAAAGRHAERSAADNSVTAAAPAETEEREDRADKKEEKAEAPKAAIAAPVTAQGAAQLGGEAPGGGAPPAVTAAPAPAAQPPPPPPPPPKAAATAKSAPPPPAKSASLLPDNGDSFGAGGLGLSGTGQGGGGTGEGTIGLGQIGTLGKGGGGGTGQGYGAGGGSIGSRATSPNAVASKLVHTKDGDLKKCFKAGTTVHARVTIDANGKATVFFTEKTVTDEQKTCVKNVVDTLEFAKVVAMAALVIKA